MKIRPLLLLPFFLNAAFAADLPRIPSKSIAEKKELLFSDDFENPKLAEVWHQAVPAFVVENGALKGTQVRDKTIPAADGKKEVQAHAAVHGLNIPSGDSVVEVKIRFEGATTISVEYVDRAYTGSHYGHLCRTQIRLNGVTIIDERDGNMRTDIREMRKDPAKKAEADKLLIGRQITYPAKFETGKWYQLVVETVGEEMRVTIDGEPVAYLKSSGIAHATKSKFEFGVAGKDGFFDDLKIYKAEPVKK